MGPKSMHQILQAKFDATLDGPEWNSGSSDDEDNNDNDMQVDDTDTLVEEKADKKSKSSKRKNQEKKSSGLSSNVIYLGHLPVHFEEQAVRIFLSQFGDIVKLRLSRSKKSGKCRGYGYVKFVDVGVAAIVADTMNGYFLGGKRLVSHVLSEDQLHPRLFDGANSAFKFINWRNKNMVNTNNKKRSDEDHKQLSQRLVKREEKTREKLKSLGICYDFPGYKASIERFETELEPKRKEAMEKVDKKDSESENGKNASIVDHGEPAAESIKNKKGHASKRKLTDNDENIDSVGEVSSKTELNQKSNDVIQSTSATKKKKKNMDLKDSITPCAGNMSNNVQSSSNKKEKQKFTPSNEKDSHAVSAGGNNNGTPKSSKKKKKRSQKPVEDGTSTPSSTKAEKISKAKKNNDNGVTSSATKEKKKDAITENSPSSSTPSKRKLTPSTEEDACSATAHMNNNAVPKSSKKKKKKSNKSVEDETTTPNSIKKTAKKQEKKELSLPLSNKVGETEVTAGNTKNKAKISNKKSANEPKEINELSEKEQDTRKEPMSTATLSTEIKEKKEKNIYKKQTKAASKSSSIIPASEHDPSDVTTPQTTEKKKKKNKKTKRRKST